MLHTSSLIRRTNVRIRSSRPREQEGWRCPCRAAWAERVAREADEASCHSERILAAYEQIGSDLVEDEWRQRNRTRVIQELEIGYAGSVSPDLLARHLEG